MKHYAFDIQNVCAKHITFDLENGNLYNVKFQGGCPGNLLAISKLLEGYDAQKAVEILKGNPCGLKKTSCTDQLAQVLQDVLNQE